MLIVVATGHLCWALFVWSIKGLLIPSTNSFPNESERQVQGKKTNKEEKKTKKSLFLILY